MANQGSSKQMAIKTEEEKKQLKAAIKAAVSREEKLQRKLKNQQRKPKKLQRKPKKAAEERLKQLENLKADEKARIPLSE